VSNLLALTQDTKLDIDIKKLSDDAAQSVTAAANFGKDVDLTWANAVF